MKALIDQITNNKCQAHGQETTFLSIDVDCKEIERNMCHQCLNLSNTSEVINITNAFEFLHSKQIEQDAIIYQCQANIWQNFQRTKTQIIELLSELEHQLNTLLKSMLRSSSIEMIYKNFINRDINNTDIQNLGLLLSGQIMLDNDGKYQFPQEMIIQEQDGYIKSNEILITYEKAMNLLRGQLISIEVNNINDSNIELEQSIIMDDSHSSSYQTSQTILLHEQCNYLYFNHDQTQLVAAVGIKILIFNLTNQGLWVKDEQQLIGHTESIWQVKFNHNSTQIASCGKDKQIIIWNKQLNKWSIQDKLVKHIDQVSTINYNHNSTILVSGSLDKTIQIHVFNNDKLELKQQLIKHTNSVIDTCFNQNSTLLASASHDKSIILWECNSGGQWIVKQKLNGHSDAVCSVKFNSNSTQLVSGSRDNSIKLWSVDNSNNWKCYHTLTEHTDSIRSVCFNQQTNMIVSSSKDKSVRIWRINEENNWEYAQIIHQHRKIPACAIISSDSSTIISGSSAIKVHRLWNNNKSL